MKLGSVEPVAAQILAIRMNTQMIRWYWAGRFDRLVAATIFCSGQGTSAVD
jgi:hypothetical protein